MENRTAKLLAAQILENYALQLEILEKSRDSETKFLGARELPNQGVIIEQLPLEPETVFYYQGLNLGQSCLNAKGLKIKLLNVIKA